MVIECLCRFRRAGTRNGSTNLLARPQLIYTPLAPSYNIISLKKSLGQSPHRKSGPQIKSTPAYTPDPAPDQSAPTLQVQPPPDHIYSFSGTIDPGKRRRNSEPQRKYTARPHDVDEADSGRGSCAHDYRFHHWLSGLDLTYPRPLCGQGPQ